MKRTRDDTCVASQLKRTPGSSRGDSYGQSQAPGGGGGGRGGGSGGEASAQKLTTDDALTYLKQVKEMFQDQREKYDTFLEVMKDFKAQRTDTAGVIARVKELFKGHNKLIYGFNTFLPKGYEITLDEDENPPKKTVEFEEAISFVNKIKKRFQKDEHVYKSFLDILNMYRKEHKDISEVYSEVATLFEDHPDLLDEFTRFLPDTSASPPAYPVSHRHPIQRVNERSSGTHTTPQIIDKQRVHRDRLLNSGHDLGVDHSESDNDKTMMKLHKEQRKHAEKDNRDRRNRDLGGRDCNKDDSRDYNLVRFAERKKLIRTSEGFRGNADFASSDDKDTFTSMYSQAFSFCEKVKERLGSSDDYQAFLKCLHIFSNGIIKRNDLQNLVTDLLGKYPDLMEEFNDFLERCENIDGLLAGVMSKKSFSDANSSRMVKLEDKEQKRDTDGVKEKERYREKYMAKSIQELDLSNCQRCTPSYRLLPDDYPIAPATQRSELGALVLNDHWVSVTSGSEDYSFKHMRRNQYEESLFRCEDDRFELDMLLESVSSAAKRVEELLNIFKENKNKESAFRIEDHFTALNIRCIERLYGDHGLDVIDILRKNPTLALPVILARLNQKQEEWAKCREDFNKVWAEIYAKNHYKSLDHRSFYFKQQDSKNLSTKSMVAEIKEIKEKHEKEDDIVQTIASSNKHTPVPHLEFEYSDVDIHEDLYKLILYSCQELCSSKEQLSKVMRLWTTFMEPMLGVAPHPHGAESREDRKASNVMDSTSLSREKENRSPVAVTAAVNSQLKRPAKNEVGNRMLEAESISHSSHDNGDKEKGSAYNDHIRRDDTISSNCHTEKEQNNVSNDHVDQLANYNVSFAVNVENIHTRTSLEMASGCSSQHHDAVGKDTSVPRSHVDTLLSSEVRDGFDEAGKVSRHFEESSRPFKIEKEEGELSPNGDLGEDNFVGYGDADLAMAKSRQRIERRPYEPCHVGEDGRLDARRDNDADADADDEDSENVSEAGEDVTGSESAGDECSQGEHEEEDVEQDDDDSKAESEGEAKGMSDAPFAALYGQTLPLSEQFISSVKPLVKHVPPMFCGEERISSRILYGNDDFYILFRLHQTLYERVASAKINSMSAGMKLKMPKDDCGLDPYSRFMSALYNLLDGSVDNSKYEDECRSLIGNQSYVLFTLVKLIYKLVKQLQAVSSDDTDNKLLQLYEYEKSRKPGKLIDAVYYANTRIILNEENIYRFECSCSPCKLSIQMMDNLNEKSEGFAVSIDPYFTHYLYNEFLLVSSGKNEHRVIALQRNKCRYIGLDELSAMSLAMEGVQAVNGLECKIACNSSKISYVLDTEDFFIRLSKRRRSSSAGSGVLSRNCNAREERFHRFLDNIVVS